MRRDPIGPIYDATAPLTCTASRSELDARVEQLERLHADLERVERTEHGLVLHLRDRPGVEAEARRFAVDEKGCCGFWGFDVTVSGAGVVLRWDGPPDLHAFMDDLAAALRGDEPITAATGLF